MIPEAAKLNDEANRIGRLLFGLTPMELEAIQGIVSNAKPWKDILSTAPERIQALSDIAFALITRLERDT